MLRSCSLCLSEATSIYCFNYAEKGLSSALCKISRKNAIIERLMKTTSRYLRVANWRFTLDRDVSPHNLLEGGADIADDAARTNDDAAHKAIVPGYTIAIQVERGRYKIVNIRSLGLTHEMMNLLTW